jgi:transposase
LRIRAPQAPAQKRIDAIFDIEREINGKDTGTRLAARHERSRPLVEGLRSWLIAERGKLSKHNGVAKAIDDFTTLKHGRWAAFTAFLDDGRICLTTNAAERALRGITLGRKSWLFAGSERGGDRAWRGQSVAGTERGGDRAWRGQSRLYVYSDRDGKNE